MRALFGLVTGLIFDWADRLRAPVLMDRFDLPTAQAVNPRLVAGAAIFGIGWGIGGFCPGPALTSLALVAPGTLVSVPRCWPGSGSASAPARRA